MTTEAATDPVEYMREDIVRISLPIPLRDLRQVNCYAVLDDVGIALIDPGWRDDRSEVAIVEALAALGAAPEDVRKIFVTHAHWDHYTRALDWQERYGTPVHLGLEEQHSIATFDPAEGLHPEQVRILRRCGAEQQAAAVESLAVESFERDQPFGPPRVWVEASQTLEWGTHAIRAYATPGHTRGHVAYELIGTSTLFTGDHLLPKITPSLGFERAPESSPLTSYLASLHTFADRDDLLMLPAHGPVKQTVGSRSRELIDHHGRRLEQIRQIVAAGHHTALTVAQQMVWTRAERNLADLGAMHEMVAILEVRAHLEHLVRGGEFVKSDTAVETYSLSGVGSPSQCAAT